jgi:purine-nucleoside/S-methyl-5'-thioadenosine phosphorylase / adenosine deaminase
MALVCEPLERYGFTNAFSTRIGGVSPMPHDDLNLAGFVDDDAENIFENRRRFMTLFDGPWVLTACWQVHGNDVRVVKDASDARSDEERCDALTTIAPGILLAVKTADCVPVLLGDRQTGAVAAVHAGWRGTLSGIVGETLERMAAEFGTKAGDVAAAIGPAATSCCYEVGHEVIDAFRDRFGAVDHLFRETRDGHAMVDLHQANREQLIAAGVNEAEIYSSGICTMCRTDIFFSYRKEKGPMGRTGRLMSVIGKG